MSTIQRYNNELNFIYFSPTKIIYGKGSIKEIPLEMENHNKKKAVIVTDKFLYENHKKVKECIELLGKKCCYIYYDVPPDSSLETVNSLYNKIKELNVDTVISIGGGSVIDTGKAIAILLKEGGRIEDHLGFQSLSRPQTFHIAVPTTAGTGSEVTKYIVLKDTEKGQKLIIGENYVIPNIAILDPELTLTLPPKLTASTAIDALSHCIESLHSLQSQPISDGLALYGIELIFNYLPKVLKEPNSLHYRGQLQIAATLGGIAFDNAQVGLVHAFAHVIGAKFNIHHGVAIGVMLPYVIKFNSVEKRCEEIYKRILLNLGIERTGTKIEQNPTNLVKRLKEFIKGVGLPTTLKELNIKKESIEDIAESTLYDPSIVYNGRYAMEKELLIEILKEAYDGGEPL